MDALWRLGCHNQNAADGKTQKRPHFLYQNGFDQVLTTHQCMGDKPAHATHVGESCLIAATPVHRTPLLYSMLPGVRPFLAP